MQVEQGFHDGNALHIAARLGHAEVVEALLKNGAQRDPRDEADRTPLSYAASSARGDIVRLLLAAGAQNEDVGRSRLLLPRPRNHLFTGRDDILTRIEESLDAKERHPLALVGFGGTGYVSSISY